MKSKKKLLLLGVGAMSAMALAVGATSTFAWYTASASRSITAGNDLSNSSLATGASATTVDNLYVTVSIASSDTVALTTSDGYAMGIVNGKCVEASGTNTLFGVASLTVNAYTTWDDKNSNTKIDDGELEGTPTAEDYSRLTAGSKTVRITAGSNRTRVAAVVDGKTTKTDRSHFTSHTWKWGGDVDETKRYIEITLTIASGQETKDAALSLAASEVNFSVTGDTSNNDKATVNNQTIAAEGAVGSVNGVLTSHIS